MGIYADEGITGTSMENRDEFNRMIADCHQGKIDLIVCKNGSVAGMLRNERYCGDVLARKTFTPNYLTHRSRKNNQDRNQYLCRKGWFYPKRFPITIMLQRNLIYTGITRAKKLLVLIGSKKALAMAIRNNNVVKRNTRLASRIREFLAH